MKRKSYRRAFQHLQKQNTALQRENEKLRLALQEIKTASKGKEGRAEEEKPHSSLKKGRFSTTIDKNADSNSTVIDTASHRWSEQDFGRRFRGKNFFSYISGTVKDHGFYRLASKGMRAFRRLRLVSTIFFVGGKILLILETSAAFFLFWTSFVLALPFLLGGFLLTWLSLVLRTHEVCRLLKARLGAARVLVLFAGRDTNLQPRGFFYANATDFAARGYVVLIVSPYFLSVHGPRRRSYYTAARQEEPGIYLLRKYFFFSLRRRVLSHRQNVTYLYGG